MSNVIFPSYYPLFKCIADKCKHSCCIGWEIDVDEKTMSFYNSLDTEFGETIRKNIEGEVPHFVLRENERCPFLNEKGLCDIIINCGEDALCDICSLHPRFNNFYDSFTETGLGLCCEEAARIILSYCDKVTFSGMENINFTDEEKMFLSERKKVLDILQDRNKSILKRFELLASQYGLTFQYDNKKLCDLYKSLERLDENWTKILETTVLHSSDGKIFEKEEYGLFFEQLAVYFVFRHMKEGMWDEDYTPMINFVLMSCYFVGMVIDSFGWENYNFEHYCDIVRMYSGEVEYSEDNTEKLMYSIYENQC